MSMNNDESVLAGWERFLSEPREPKTRLRCEYCDRPLFRGMNAFEVRNDIVCKECAEKEFDAGFSDGERFCDLCGEELSEDDAAYAVHEKTYCKTCFEDMFGFTVE